MKQHCYWKNSHREQYVQYCYARKKNFIIGVTYAEFDNDKFNNSFKYLKTNLKFISGSTVQNMKH